MTDKLITGFSTVLLCAAAAAAPEDLTGTESWGNRRAHPAVVNAVMADADDPYVLSLRGTWDFCATLAGNRRNIPWGAPYTGEGSLWTPGWDGAAVPLRPIRVPGCWEAQLADAAESVSRPWACRWDCAPMTIRGMHDGDGWYRRYVRIPESWKGRRVWLKTGWVNGQGFFWVNGGQVAMDANYCATRKYEISDLVRFGATNCVVVQVNNTAPSHRGCVNFQQHWGGILRDIEIESTPQTFIDDAWVRGDFDGKTAKVKVEVEGPIGVGLRLRATVEGETHEIALSPSASPSHFDLDLPLRHFRPWSPERPNLYTATVELVSGGTVVQTRRERFGVRKLETRGREVFLNGKPFFLRGAGWHEIEPVDGYPKPDREMWLGRVRLVRSAGFNIVRTHTHCKMPEFYEACDEAGLMVEAELPYYGDVASDGQRFDPRADAEMLYRHFRRHPSFAVYSFGNEGSFGPALSQRLYCEVKARDPDRLVVGQDGACGPRPLNVPGTSDFAGGPCVVVARGSYRPGMPYFYHEFVNSSVKFDSRAADAFTGAWAAPISRAGRAAFLAPFGLDLAWGDRLQDGQNRMQKTYLKYGLESARLDGWSCGYCYWSLQDACCPQDGTSIGQALWNPFWKTKRCGPSAADVAVYNAPTCVLMTDGDDAQEYPERPYTGDLFLDSTITNLVRTSGDTIRARFHLAHYGEAPLKDAQLAWRLVAEGKTLASGAAEIGDQPLGAVRPVASADIVVPPLAKPVEARLVATVYDGATSQTNDWRYWLFPKRKPLDAAAVLCAASYRAALAPRYPGMRFCEDAASADFASVRTVIAPFGSELERRALAAGRHVVALANQRTPRNVTLGWWYMTEQMGAALVGHPAVAGLPHDGLFEPLFFRIGREGLKLPVEGFAKDDLVMVGEGGKGCYLYLAFARRTDGARHGLIAGLDVLTDTAEGTALLDGFLGETLKAESRGTHAESVPAVKPSGRKIRVACIGDSITWGYAMTNRVEECYPAQLQRLLGPAYEVRNFGDPGACVYSQPKQDPNGWTAHAWRTGRNGPAAYAFMPDIVVCNLGINDSGTYLYEFTYDENGRPKTEPGLFRREYAELLDAFARDGKKPRIVMWTRLGPLGKRHAQKGTPGPFVMEADLRAVAEAVGAETLDMYAPLLPYAETPDFAADGVHPEGGAQRVIAEITARRIVAGPAAHCE